MPAIAGARGSERVRQQLEWEAAAVSQLSPWQIAIGLPNAVVRVEAISTVTGSGRQVPKQSALITPFAGTGDRIMYERATARLYAALTLEQRDLLAAGELPYESLSAQSRELADYANPLLSFLNVGGKRPNLRVVAEAPPFYLTSGDSGAFLGFQWLRLDLAGSQ